MKFRCLPLISCAPAERCNNGECWDPGNSVGWGGYGDIPVPCLHTFMPLLLSQEPKNSLKTPKNFPSIHRWNSELTGAEPLAQNPFPPHGRTLQTQSFCCRYSVMVIESALLSFSWLWRSHRRTLKTTAALWIVTFTLPKLPEIVLEVFLFVVRGVLPLKKPPLKNISHFSHSVKQLLAICLTSGDGQRFFFFF